MGEVRATTVSDLAGTGPVDLTGQSAAKVWCRYSGSSASIADSFNVSSLTDYGAGDQEINFTNNMSDANFAFAADCNNYHTLNNGTAAGTDRVGTYNSSHSAVDSGRVAACVYGDLA